MTSAPRQNGAPEEERKKVGAPADPRVPTGVPGGDQPGPAAAGTEGERGAAEVEHDFDELLADVKRERDEYLELAQRARADFENFRKRASRDAEEAERRGKAGLARQLVPALDNLERALRSAGIDPDGTTAAPAEPESRAARAAQRKRLAES